MKKIWLVALSIISATWLVAGITMTTAAAGLSAPQEEMIIEGEKKSARFSHPVHLNVGLDCAECHHDSNHEPLTVEKIEAMDSGEQLRCASCHNEDFANPKLKTTKAAFHANCKDCHKQPVGDKQGPTKCTGCHVKK